MRYRRASLVFVVFCLAAGCKAEVSPSETAGVAGLRQMQAEVEIGKPGSPSQQRAVVVNASWQLEFGDAGLAHLENLTEVHTLRLEGTAISDQGLNVVVQLTKLRNLSLYKTKVTSECLPFLAQCPELRELGLNETKVSDQNLDALQRLTNLESLWLDGTKITDQGLAALKPMTQLRSLGLRDTEVTAKGVMELRKSLPRTMIYFQRGGVQ